MRVAPVNDTIMPGSPVGPPAKLSPRLSFTADVADEVAAVAAAEETIAVTLRRSCLAEGVGVILEQDDKPANKKGPVAIQKITPGSLADSPDGLRQKDLVLDVNGEPVHTMQDVATALAGAPSETEPCPLRVVLHA